MFDVGEYAVCGSKGVCRVEDITTLDISGVDKTRKYYILRPIYMSTSVVYVPVDTQTASMRKVLEREAAQELIDHIPDVTLINIKEERMLEKIYKECMKTNQCSEWMKLLKTIYLRQQERIQTGRKVTAVDDRFYRIVVDNLFGEFAIALDRSKEEIEKDIMAKLEAVPMQ